MKNKELFELLPQLDTLKNLSGVELAYKVIFNKNEIKKIYAIYQEMISSDSDYKLYDSERVKLCNQYADLDEFNKPIINNNMFQIINNREEFELRLRQLTEEYESAIVDHQIKQNNGLEFLNSQSVLEFLKIEKSELPYNITVEQMEIVMCLM